MQAMKEASAKRFAQIEQMFPHLKQFVENTPELFQLRAMFEGYNTSNAPADQKLWIKTSLDSWMISKVFNDPTLVVRLLVSGKKSSIDKAFIKELGAHPPTWTLFTLTEEIAPNVWRVCSEYPRKEFTIYDHRIGILLKRVSEPIHYFVGLMFPNEVSVQAEGPLYYFNSISAEELISAYSIVCPNDVIEENGLTAAVITNPILLFHLSTFSETPPLIHLGEVVIDHTVFFATSEGFDGNQLMGFWDKEEARDGTMSYYYDGISDLEIDSCALTPEFYGRFKKDEKSFWEPVGMMGGEIIYNKANDELAFLAMNASGLQRIKILLASAFKDGTLPPIAKHYQFSTHVRDAIEGLVDVPPWDELLARFDEEEDPIDAELFNQLSNFMTEYTTAYNMGLPLESIADLAKKHGVPLETAEESIKTLRRVDNLSSPSLTQPKDQRKYSLSYPEPPPQLRHLFTNDYSDDGPITFDEVKDSVYETFYALTQWRYVDDADRLGLPWYFQEVFEKEFGQERANTVMHTFFYILLHCGDKAHLVRSYAWELVKTFPFSLANDKRKDVEPFIEQFSRFVAKVLANHAIVDIFERPKGESLKKGLFEIKGSQFFLENFHFNKDWRNL